MSLEGQIARPSLADSLKNHGLPIRENGWQGYGSGERAFSDNAKATDDIQRRTSELSSRQRSGGLTESEQRELEGLLRQAKRLREDRGRIADRPFRNEPDTNVENADREAA